MLPTSAISQQKTLKEQLVGTVPSWGWLELKVA
jgi:hypothetical protein